MEPYINFIILGKKFLNFISFTFKENSSLFVQRKVNLSSVVDLASFPFFYFPFFPCFGFCFFFSVFFSCFWFFFVFMSFLVFFFNGKKGSNLVDVFGRSFVCHCLYFSSLLYKEKNRNRGWFLSFYFYIFYFWFSFFILNFLLFMIYFFFLFFIF